jgi:hypothetical protein
MASSSGMVGAANRPMSLSTAAEAQDEVEQVIRCSPRRYGIKRSRWRLQDVRQVIPWLRDCTIPGVHQILKRLEISLKQAISFVRSPDPLFTVKRRLMAQAFSAALHHPEEYVVLLQDELTYWSQPDRVLKYGFIGQHAPLVYHAVAANKMTRIGALMNGITGQVHYLQRDKFGKLAMAELYRLARRVYPQRKIFVIQDNVPFHYCDNVLATAAELDITPVFLPTYASWLNPIEKLWRWLKADVLHGHEFAHDYKRLRQVVAAFLDQFAGRSSALLRYVGLLPA